MGLAAYGRLIRAGFVLAREGAFSVFDPAMLPPSMRMAFGAARILERRSVKRTGKVERLTRALNRLGPTYVKFGQTLATRPDIVGEELAEDLSALQDRMEPFDPKIVPELLEEALGPRAKDIIELSPPIAAASIAQVHKAKLRLGQTREETVAIKVLRPGVKTRFMRDLESYYAGARLAERFVPPLRRLRPVQVVEALDHSAKLELDLRFEAAAISEFQDNIANDDGFGVPDLHWDYGAENILVTSWIDGVPVRDLEALDSAGVDRKKLAANLIQSFLRHAIRDGFFHADMHPGNLFADPKTQGIIAVDFGITGRIGKKERRFLADILYGFISRDYRMLAERHFEIGYVPEEQSIDDFALALRSIGEPLQGRLASEISMGKVLGQLFSITDLFSMQARPELILLQKNMVLVEGVARTLDPELDIWTISEPIVSNWVRHNAGPLGRLSEMSDHLRVIGNTLGQLPDLVTRTNSLLADYEAHGLRRKPVFPPWMLVSGFIVFVVTCAALIAGALT